MSLTIATKLTVKFIKIWQDVAAKLPMFFVLQILDCEVVQGVEVVHCAWTSPLPFPEQLCECPQASVRERSCRIRTARVATPAVRSRRGYIF